MKVFVSSFVTNLNRGTKGKTNLLIVCPACLKYAWKNEIENWELMTAYIGSSDTLWDRAHEMSRRELAATKEALKYQVEQASKQADRAYVDSMKRVALAKLVKSKEGEMDELKGELRRARTEMDRKQLLLEKYEEMVVEATETCREQHREIETLREQAAKAKFLQSIVESIDTHIEKTVHAVRNAVRPCGADGRHLGLRPHGKVQVAQEVNDEMERLVQFVKHLGVVLRAYQSPVKMRQVG